MNKHREFEALARALADLREIQHEGQAVNQLDHALQTATRLRRWGGLVPDRDLIIAGLVHDVGKLWHEEHHAAVAAGILDGRVRPAVLEALWLHSEMREGRREPATPEQATLLATDEASVDDPSYDADPLSSFLVDLERVMAR